jgi:hypothetical protein
MVHCLLDIQFVDGFFQGCILDKHPEEKFEKGKAWRASYILELVHSDVTCHFQHP